MDPVVVKDLVRTYGEGDAQTQALRGVSLVIRPGEYAAIAGPSGSGKSTLLNMIGGLDTPTSGTVLVDGQDLSRLSRTRLSRLRMERIGFIFQAYNLLPVMTALENAEYVLLLQKVPAPERRRRILALFEEVGLQGLEHRFPRELSGGQQQRVAIVRAIAADPALVLADEPTANVDSRTAESLMELMERLNHDKGVTFLFSTHDQNIMKRAHRLIHLKDGRIENDEVKS